MTLDAHFVNDLGLDSLDQVEITMAVEDEFNIEIPDKEADEIYTPRQAVEVVLFLIDNRSMQTRIQCKLWCSLIYSTI